jgi:small-conductance mechanosensitive channel
LTLAAQQWVVSCFKFSPEGSWMRITLLRKIALFILYTVAALMISQCLGQPIAPILATLGIGSLAVALALKDILSNFFAGIQIAVDRPLEIGQAVTLENGMSGRVLALGWLKTSLRMDDGSLLFVPNSRMTSFIIQNLTLSGQEAATVVKLSIDRTSDLDRAEQVALAAARQMMAPAESPTQTPAREPSTRYTLLGAAAAELSVTLRAENHSAIPELRSAYLKAVNTALAQAGVKIV